MCGDGEQSRKAREAERKLDSVTLETKQLVQAVVLT